MVKLRYSPGWQHVRERHLEDVCRFLDIRDQNTKKLIAKGMMGVPALKGLREQVDAEVGSMIRGHRFSLRQIIGEYEKRPGGILTRKEIVVAVRQMIRSYRKLRQWR